MRDDERKEISKKLSELYDRVPQEDWPKLWCLITRAKDEARERHKKPRKKLTTEAYYHIFVACAFIADWCPAKKKAPQ